MGMDTRHLVQAKWVGVNVDLMLRIEGGEKI